MTAPPAEPTPWPDWPRPQSMHGCPRHREPERPISCRLSLLWTGDRAVIAIAADSRTASNLAESRFARLAVGPTRDVVMIDASVERTVDVDADDALGAAYAAQAGWDPRGLDGYRFLVLRPNRIQAWRESNEMAGRLLMRDGAWID